MKQIPHSKSTFPWWSDEAIEIYDHAIETAPDSPWGYFHRAIAYRNQNKCESALNDFERALELDDQYVLAYGCRGELYNDLAEGYQERALKDYSNALRLNPRDTFSLFHRGNLHSRSGDFFQAISDYTAAIKLKPDANLLFQRGVIFLQQKQTKLAAKDFAQAVAIMPDHLPSIMNLGLVLFELNETPEEAIRCFKKVLSLNNKEQEAQLALMVAVYQENSTGDCADKLSIFDKKWFKIAFLRDQLWGSKLLKKTQFFLQSQTK